MSRFLLSLAAALATTQFMVLEMFKSTFPQSFQYPTSEHRISVAAVYSVTTLILFVVFYTGQWLVGL